MKRLSLGLVVVVLLSVGRVAMAQETPAVLVWTPSLASFLEQSKTLLTQIGQADAANTLTQQALGKLGAKGLTGIDGSRPLGLFLRFNPDPSGALVIPISQEREFLDLLERFDLKSAKDADGIYKLAAPIPVPVYLKFTAKHAWITILNKTGFAAPIDPNAVFPAQTSLVSARVRIDALPKDARQLAISHFEDTLQQAMKQNAPAGSPAQKAFTEACNQALARLFAQALEEGKQLSFDFGFNAKDKDIAVNLVLEPRPGTPLAKSLADAGQRSSVFAAPVGQGLPPLSAKINVALPDPVAKAFAQLVEESFTQSAGKFQNPEKKKQAQELFDALKPSLDAGEIDAVFRVLGPGPEKKMGVVVGVKTTGGERLGGVFKTLADDARKLMTDAEKEKMILDADTVGTTKIHRFVLASEGQGRKVTDVFGDPTLSIAFRPDAVLFGIGHESSSALKALAAVSKPGVAPLVVFAVDGLQLAPLLASGTQLRAAEGIFTQKTDGFCQFTITGGEQLNVGATIRTPVIRFLGQTRAEKVDAK